MTMDMEKNEAALFHEGQRNDALIAALKDFPIFLNSSELTTEEKLMKYITHVCANLKDVDFQMSVSSRVISSMLS